MLLKIYEVREKGVISRKFKISYKQYDYNLKGRKKFNKKQRRNIG